MGIGNLTCLLCYAVCYDYMFLLVDAPPSTLEQDQKAETRKKNDLHVGKKIYIFKKNIKIISTFANTYFSFENIDFFS